MSTVNLDGDLIEVDGITRAYVQKAQDFDGNKWGFNGKYKVTFYVGGNEKGTKHVSESKAQQWLSLIEQAKKGHSNMLKDITTDMKAFMHDNRNVLYWLAVAFLADHFFFGGAFRARLNSLVEKMIGRVEKQIEAKA